MNKWSYLKTKENWKPIMIDNGAYCHYHISDRGMVKNSITGHILKPLLCGNRRQYLQAILWSLEYPKTHKQVYIHRLVALHFIGKPDRNLTVNHRDCNSYNCDVDNLEYLTHKQNIRHAVANGCFSKEGNPNSINLGHHYS
jgi:hypothetical protein